MKKLFAAGILALASLVPVWAQTGNVAVGPILSINALEIQSPLNGLGITGKIPGLAPVWGLNFSFGTQSNFVGLTADWLLYKQPLYAPASLNFYLGPGFYTSILVSSASRFDAGLRIPFGINWTPLKFLEIFTEFVPAFGVTFRDPVQPAWLIQGAVGGRIWF